jgi:hypothetical protein
MHSRIGAVHAPDDLTVYLERVQQFLRQTAR